MKKNIFLISLFLLLPYLVWAAAPSRTYTYTSGTTISPDEVTTNEDNIFRYLQTGVDVYADSSIISADIYDGTIVNADISTTAAITYSKLSLGSSILSTDIKDGEIVSADISSSAAIPYSKLSFSNNIVAGDIAEGAIGTSELASTAVVAGSYTHSSITVDADGRITSASNGTDNDTSLSNVVFCWFGVDSGQATTNTHGWVSGTSLTQNMAAYTATYNYFGAVLNTYRTILLGKFVKIAGISTVTIYARLWANAGVQDALLKVDIGGANNTVNRTATTPAWATSSNIDVSGLTNDTSYDITIQLQESTNAGSAYCSAIMLIAS